MENSSVLFLTSARRYLSTNCNKGLVKKEQYPEVPPRVEYSLTELGEKVLPIIDEIAKFGMENL